VKTLLALLLVLSATTGCATQGLVSGAAGNTGPSLVDTAPDPFPPTPPQIPNTMPRLVIPATGGPPVIGIPVGGDLYVPVTGGPPIPGMPVSP